MNQSSTGSNRRKWNLCPSCRYVIPLLMVWLWLPTICLSQHPIVQTIYTADEAELFLNGRSLGRKKKGDFEYRLRWDDVVYEPGELKVVAYNAGKQWATDSVKTTGPAAKLNLEADRTSIAGDGQDLSFVTLRVQDRNGLTVPRADNLITFEISGPGEIVATDNGDPTDMSSFHCNERRAFNGLALAIVKAKRGREGPITLSAKADGLAAASVAINLE